MLRPSLHQNSDACTAAATDPHPLFTAQLECSGDRNIDNQTSVLDSPSGMKTVKVGSTPYGTYSASDIPHTLVTYIDVVFPERTVTDPALFNGDQMYTLSVSGCMIESKTTCIGWPVVVTNKTETTGHFVHEKHFAGAQFIPKNKDTPGGYVLDHALQIHWCPDQNYFVVNFLGKLLDTPLVSHPTVFVTVAP